MARPPPVERFRISCETDVTSLGPVMSALAKIANLTITGNELIEDVRTFAKREVGSHHVKSEPFLEEWAQHHPTFRAIEAVKHFKADGRTASACYTALRVLSERGRLKKLGEGMYSLPGVKALPKPTKEVKQAQVRRDVDHKTFLLRTASRNHGRFNTSWMRAQFSKDGRTPGNVSPAVATLMKKKLIKRVGDSEYVLLAKAIKATPKKTDKPAMNGSAVETEAAANG